MNDIFKIFRKKQQAKEANDGRAANKTGLKSVCVLDMIKDLSPKEQDEIIEATSSRFDRASKSYLSISKSGRLKSKQHRDKASEARALKHDLFSSPPPPPYTADSKTSSASSSIIQI